MIQKPAPIEGCTRCYCGAKYWDADVCHSCGDKYRPVIVGITTPPKTSHAVVPGRGALPVTQALDIVAQDHNGDMRPELRNGTTYAATFTDPDDAEAFIDQVLETWERFTSEELV